ncbi:unnamed protein product [Brassica rapa subsp. trilocularis]
MVYASRVSRSKGDTPCAADVIVMANVLVFLSDLQAGGSSSTVEVCLLRFWEARNVRRGGELMGVDMLLLHSQAGGVGKTYTFQLSVTSFITLQSVRPSQSYASSTSP